MGSQNNEELLEQYLTRLMSEGSDGDFLVVSYGHYYVQFVKDSGAEKAWLHCEIVSNVSIPDLVSEVQASQIRHLGFEDPTPDVWETGHGSTNFSHEFYVTGQDSINMLVRTTLTVFTEIFSLNLESQLEFQLQLDLGNGDFRGPVSWTESWPALRELVERLRASSVICSEVFVRQEYLSEDAGLAVCSTASCEHPENSQVILLLDLNHKTVLARFKPTIHMGKLQPINILIDQDERMVRLIYDDFLEHRYTLEGRFIDVDRWEADRLYVAYKSRYGYDLLDIALEFLSKIDDSGLEPYSEVISLLGDSLKKDVSENTKARIHRTLGEIYHHCLDDTRALNHLKIALELDPNVGVKRLVERLKRFMNDGAASPAN